ncbi:MAG: ATP-binding cassette domain-containing protein [Acidobacteria bacterium]|nr:ATP-binding cassette domain-containing protein [Acidobacteriota bacterium]MBV9479052.1 ATP-binding cassette domain-containing protein [Acidobacteriota bacterium]
MLDLTLRNVSFRYGTGFALREISFTVPRSTHTALAGPPACGASTLLRLVAGTLTPDTGEILIGARVVNDLKPARRPLLYVTRALDVPGRWSVQHALVAAVRTRTLDREDRHREYALAVDSWQLGALLERRIDSLSSTEAARVHCARIELLRPGIVIADRVLEGVAASARVALADAFYRMLRIVGATVLSTPASRDELALTDAVVVLDDGRVVQHGSAAELFARPVDEAAAVAIGEVDAIPITIRGTSVESVIGAWELASPPFQGSGVALVRPGDFAPARAGEDSDLIFGIEEAGFADGRWLVRGVLSGGVTLRVELPRDANVHKGRLIALRYDPARFTLVPREQAPLQTTVPTDVVPSMRESR